MRHVLGTTTEEKKWNCIHKPLHACTACIGVNQAKPPVVYRDEKPLSFNGFTRFLIF